MTILLGSETYELTVTCYLCAHTEILYIPTDTELPEVQQFLMGRGWKHPEPPYWFCPSETEDSTL